MHQNKSTEFTLMHIIQFIYSGALWTLNPVSCYTAFNAFCTFLSKMFSLELNNNYITAFSAVLLMYTTIQKFGLGWVGFFLLFCKNINLSHYKIFLFQINAVLFNFYSSNNPKKCTMVPQKYDTAQQFSILKINISWTTKQHSYFWKIMWAWRLE